MAIIEDAMLSGHPGINILQAYTHPVIALCLLFLAASSSAQPVSLTSPSGTALLADYLPGERQANPVLLLHGFLQTHQFPTVSRLASALNDSGYTVLSPTLSLGLSNRKQSLSCEAIHTHSLDTDVAELKLWIDWLRQKTGKPVTLIGHSSAGPVILKYMDDHNAHLVDRTILISLSYFASGPISNETPEHARRAARALAQQTDPLDSYALSYCKNYPTTASAFLSYYRWNQARVSRVVKKFNDRIAIIIGTGDKRVASDWLKQLQAQNSHVIPIQGAGHFFDQAYEFDLLDTIEQQLANSPGQK